jgi:glycine cleavage system H protein
VKSAEDVYSPADGEVTDVNSALADSPESVNKDCYANWMVKMKVTGKLADSMNAAQYRKFIGE